MCIYTYLHGIFAFVDLPRQLAMPGPAWPGQSRPGQARPGLACQCEAGPSQARPDLAWPVVVRPDLAWPSMAWPGCVDIMCFLICFVEGNPEAFLPYIEGRN